MYSKRVAAACLLSLTVAAWLSACGTSSFVNDAADGSIVADGSDVTDATSDAGTIDVSIGDAASTTFCNSRSNALVCADFDESDERSAYVRTTPELFFSSPAIGDGGTFARLDAGESPPFAIYASLAALGDGGNTQHEAQTEGTVTDIAANHVKLEAALKFLAVGDSTSAFTLELIGLALRTPDQTIVTQYTLGIRDEHVYLDVGNGATTFGMLDLGSPPTPSNDWVFFTLDITLGPAGVLNGALGPNAVTGPSAATANQTNLRLQVGPSSFGYTGVISVGYDNVVLSAADDALPDGGVMRDD
jgi:hypothetical protein